ncbi:hypothetical protein HK098_004334 [Nowakowskiella sp. JEL0407]|nr:hypothetical protein HK098_004334 [Nowakowskiella sp. JEL0407]
MPVEIYNSFVTNKKLDSITYISTKSQLQVQQLFFNVINEYFTKERPYLNQRFSPNPPTSLPAPPSQPRMSKSPRRSIVMPGTLPKSNEIDNRTEQVENLKTLQEIPQSSVKDIDNEHNSKVCVVQ